MSWRTVLAGLLVALVVAPCPADSITFKNGTVRKVRIYKVTADYISYVLDGRIQVTPRDRVKSHKIDGKVLSAKELAEAIRASRDEMKKKVREEERRNGVKTPAKPAVKTLVGAETPDKGVRVIRKDKSKTHATELVIDPFPDHPVKPKKGRKPPAKNKKAAKPDSKKKQGGG